MICDKNENENFKWLAKTHIIQNNLKQVICPSIKYQ